MNACDGPSGLLIAANLALRVRAEDPAGIDRPNSNVASTPTSPRGGTKIAQVIELLQRGDGATLAELVAATGWLPPA